MAEASAKPKKPSPEYRDVSVFLSVAVKIRVDKHVSPAEVDKAVRWQLQRHFMAEYSFAEAMDAALDGYNVHEKDEDVSLGVEGWAKLKAKR
jgi:hypothetical protein